MREEGDTGIPVVRPEPGGEAYMYARLWGWWPILELEKGQTYRLHLSSLDWQHGFSLQPVNINIQVHPGYEMVVTITPTATGEFGVVCNEFCGIGHSTMIGRMYVVEPGQGGAMATTAEGMRRNATSTGAFGSARSPACASTSRPRP